MAENQIAYVGVDGNLSIINPDGSDARGLTVTDPRAGPGGHVFTSGSDSQIYYAWPTWSPDNTKLAATRITIYSGRPTYSLEVVDTATGQVTKVYQNEPGTSPVARGNPHCVCWSPDSKHLAFIASTQRGLVLFVSSPGQNSELMLLVEGMPLYFRWLHDSDALAIHRGEDLILVSIRGHQRQTIAEWGNVGFGFRVPAISRDSSRMTYTSTSDHGNAVYMANIQPQVSETTLMRDIGTQTALMWSPTRDELAIADSQEESGPQFEFLTIVDSQGSTIMAPISGPILAYFWSPDGDKIAYVSYQQERNRFTWNYVDRSEGRPVDLGEYWPSEEYVTMLTFFDQYACSNSLWSPDSTSIVFAGTLGPRSDTGNGASPMKDKVHVLDVRDGATSRPISTSRFASWSWG